MYILIKGMISYKDSTKDGDYYLQMSSIYICTLIIAVYTEQYAY